ncbi:MAG: ribonuclease III [Propionibacteriaceae bacterium]|nr:ribonuclease III [Propionibacteriaceae bacterium]
MNRLADRLAQLGIVVDSQLLSLAFTHRSWAYEHGRAPTNERLEFLGDSVLGVVVTDRIFRQYPDRSEGDLAKLRATVVSGHTLAQVARELGIGAYLKLGRGEIATHGDGKESILADAMEAVIGAVHLAGGFEASISFVHSLMDPVIARDAELGAALDWKSSLQELVASRELGIPVYTCETSGPDHERHFSAEVLVAGHVMGAGEASSRRGAEHIAAQNAYQALSSTPVG